MTYQVIARKWRPQTFEEVTGQEIITQTLRNALEFDRLHHAYLFSGARGVGKTTTARILAKALNCHKTDKPNLKPCSINDPDACPSCIEISESRSIDVLEIDAASHTGIENVRETIIDSINFNPARDRYKVFIIDEVHQLSKPAFNALLKTLEEPPETVVFIMATTELHKVPDTILSRCQEFEFRTIPLQKIFDRLKLIATAEKIDITDEALRELARSGEGSMRDAQSNFDQVISFSGDKITATDVTNALGFAGVEVLSKIIGAIAERDPRAALAVVDDLIARGHDLRNFCRDLLGLFRDMLVFKIAGNAGELLETAVFSGEELAAIASSFGETDLLRFFNSLCETEGSLRDAAHPRYVLEVGLIKLIEMQKVTSIESILERLDALSTGSPQPAPALAKTTGAATAAADVTSEKKTLKSEPPAFVPDIEFTDDPAIVEARTIYETPTADDLAEDWVRSRPVRLPPISSEALEHIEDQRLDDWYEDKLTFTGDDLKPLKSIATWLDKLFGVKEARAANAAVSNGNSGAAVAPAIDVSSIMPEMPRGDEEIDIPVLGENPTDEELIAYAQSHPSVRLAMRVFRAKIIEAKRS